MLHLLLRVFGTAIDHQPLRTRRHFGRHFGHRQQRIVLPQIHRHYRHLGDRVRRRLLAPQRPDGMHAQRRLGLQQPLQRRFDRRFAFRVRQVQQLHIVPIGALRVL
jgi:hypothetical protein